MSAVTHWFACGCGRNFVEHHAAGVKPSGQCPSCGDGAEKRTITETAAQISAAAEKTSARTGAKRRA